MVVITTPRVADIAMRRADWKTDVHGLGVEALVSPVELV
jgi:hypothetical protein